MINIEKLTAILSGYKSSFHSTFADKDKNEKYKWEAVKWFQDNWDIEAADFAGMFKKATEKTANLLASGYAYPRGMMINFALADPETVRTMFRALFDEKQDLALRIETFRNESEELRVKYDDGSKNNSIDNRKFTRERF